MDANGNKTGGRKRGTPNKATAEVRELALRHGPEAVEELARLSKEAASETARVSAIGMLIDRAYGRALPGRPIRIDLPDTSTVDGAKRAVAKVVQSAASGEITPGEAADFCAILDAQQRAIELADVEERLRKLEEKDK